MKNKPTHADIARQAYNPESRDWKLFEQSVQNIAKWVINHTGQPPLAVNLRDDSIASKDREYQQVRDAFVKFGFVWSDTEPGHYHPVSRFEGHPNNESNWWYADAIFKTIVQRNLIPAESPNTDASQ
jgi:hypothetical protein